MTKPTCEAAVVSWLSYDAGGYQYVGIASSVVQLEPPPEPEPPLPDLDPVPPPDFDEVFLDIEPDPDVADDEAALFVLVPLFDDDFVDLLVLPLAGLVLGLVWSVTLLPCCFEACDLPAGVDPWCMETSAKVVPANSKHIPSNKVSFMPSGRPIRFLPIWLSRDFVLPCPVG